MSYFDDENCNKTKTLARKCKRSRVMTSHQNKGSSGITLAIITFDSAAVEGKKVMKWGGKIQSHSIIRAQRVSAVKKFQ